MYDALCDIRLRTSAQASTEMIGPTEASASSPKVSASDKLPPNPEPRARTIGTVMASVVTPALSHAMLIMVSSLMDVRTKAMRYPVYSIQDSFSLYTNFSTPRARPDPTPRATESITSLTLRWWWVSSSTVTAMACSAGSARVAPKPRQNAAPKHRATPTVWLYTGDPWTDRENVKRPGSAAPTLSPRGLSPYSIPRANRTSPIQTQNSDFVMWTKGAPCARPAISFSLSVPSSSSAPWSVCRTVVEDMRPRCLRTHFRMPKTKQSRGSSDWVASTASPMPIGHSPPGPSSPPGAR
mmetsp:Transcript_70593/g.124399  ORF Transcript_70593/g.124399 Transcript_70593/m.124399 type:complete len:296 (-) Transcript_70593:827-1714(-)